MNADEQYAFDYLKRECEALKRERKWAEEQLQQCALAYDALKLFKDDEVQKLLERIVKLGEERLEREQRIHSLETLLAAAQRKLERNDE